MAHFKILHYIGRDDESKRMVRIKFLNTEYETDVLLKYALKGIVKDYTVNYHDRQFASNVDSTLYDDYIIELLSRRWRSMMARCYNKNDHNYCIYGQLGVRVADCWHNLDNFLSDVMLVENFNKFYHNPNMYQLDKDYYQFNLPKSERYYGPGRCIFLSIYDNGNLAILEKYGKNSLFGVKEINKNKYQVEFSIDGTKYQFGVYSDIKAAANAYNHYYMMYTKAELVQLLNNVEFMPFEVTQQYLINI